MDEPMLLFSVSTLIVFGSTVRNGMTKLNAIVVGVLLAGGNC